MRWSIGRKIGGTFALALFALVAVGAVSYVSTTKLIDSADWVAHTHQVLNGLEEVISALQDADTGQRGDVMTAAARYLEPYRGAREAVEQRVRDLRRLTSDNPVQQQRLNVLEPLVASKFAELQKVIDLRRDKGFAPASQEVLTDKGKTEMDSIRRLVGEMANEENNLLAKRSAEEKDRALHTELTIVLGSIFSFVLLILVGLFLTRNIANPLREVSSAAQKIASGDLAVTISSDSRRDEVGVLAQSFAQMTQSLEEVARAAEQIASGDLTVELRPRSERDV